MLPSSASATGIHIPSAMIGPGCRIWRRFLVTFILAALANGCGGVKDEENKLAYHDAREVGLRFGYPADLYLARVDRAVGEAPRISMVLLENLPTNVAYVRGTATEPMEGPPMITIDVYENAEALSVYDWFRDRTNWGSQARELRTTVAGGRELLEYRWDGLYAGRTAMIAGDDYIYVLSVTWVSEDDRLPAIYDSLLASLELARR